VNRRFAQEIQVTIGKGKTPLAFRWRGRVHRVIKVQECWRLVGAWWDGEGEMTFFRVRTDLGGFYDLGYDHARGTWTLIEVQD